MKWVGNWRDEIPKSLFRFRIRVPNMMPGSAARKIGILSPCLKKKMSLLKNVFVLINYFKFLAKWSSWLIFEIWLPDSYTQKELARVFSHRFSLQGGNKFKSKLNMTLRLFSSEYNFLKLQFKLILKKSLFKSDSQSFKNISYFSIRTAIWCYFNCKLKLV
jgi:hypothetical protein